MRRMLHVPLFLMLAGCAGSGPMATIAQHSVEGTWTLTATIRGGLADCYVGGVELRLTDTDSGFAGSASGGAVVCADGTHIVQTDAPPRTVSRGTITGDSVSFALDARFSSYLGVFEGDDVMRGEFSEGAGTGANTGVWRATRH